jgi:mRNA-degrading endonuclease RelE of RelBE toxin-antitoxin system
MPYRLRIDTVAQSQIDEFAIRLRDYSEELASEQIDRLNRIIQGLRDSPLIWSYFPFTGAPYRAYLFRVGRRTQYWVIYTVDEETRTVDILQFWHTSRDLDTLEL